MDFTIGIGEYAISNNVNDTLKTYALATCVAITAYYPKGKVAGMVHIPLPSSNSVSDSALRSCYFVNTAIPLLINKICVGYGCPKSELEINIFGCAKSIQDNDFFHISEGNIIAAMNELNRLNLNYKSAEVGGTNSRTLEMNVATGQVKVTLQPMTI